MSDQTALALYLLQEKHNDDSFFQPYINTLPRHYANFPVFYSKREMGLLRGTVVFGMIKQRRLGLRSEYKELSSALVGRLRSYNDFVWAKTAVMTRVFKREGGGVGLVPMADMINHKHDPGTVWSHNQDGFKIRNTRTLARCSEVHDSYGKKCNSRYLVNYGFVLPDNRLYNQACVSIDPSSVVVDEKERTRKQALLGLPGSYDDGYIGHVQTGREFRFQITVIPPDMTRSKRDALSVKSPVFFTSALFSFVRVLLCSDTDLQLYEAHMSSRLEDRESYFKKLTGGDLQGLCVKSMKNRTLRFVSYNETTALFELSVLRVVSKICRGKLGSFRTTLESDRDVLSECTDGKMKNILTALISEKEVLHWYSGLYDFVERAWEETGGDVMAVRRRLQSHVGYSGYGGMYWGSFM